MKEVLYALLFCFAFPCYTSAQLQPEENSKLHYRLVGFSFPDEGKTVTYKIELAAGEHHDVGVFERNIISTIAGKTNRIIAEVPAFGAAYTWRSVHTAGSKIVKSELHHFTTGSIPEVDTNDTRLRIIETAQKFKDAYVFVDGNRALYDMEGHAIWYVPNIGDMPNSRASVRDVKLTPFGTITFLMDDKAYEVNYKGTVLWKAPNTGAVSGDRTEHYHHEFTRLKNGHYMILGMEGTDWTNANAVADRGAMNAPGNGPHREIKPRTMFGTVIEYDEKGNLVWSWKSSTYFIGGDLEYYNPKFKMPVVDVHQNSFHFDEKNKVLYVGFRNISRIVKVKYPEGTVLASYGEIYKPGKQEQGNGLFCDQHNCRLSEKGLLYLFNNNTCKNTGLPEVVMLQEPVNVKDGLKKVWEYTCNADGVPEHSGLMKDHEGRVPPGAKVIMPPDSAIPTRRPTSGGSVQELTDHSLFVCMNTELSKMFIVTPAKKILWSAVAEKYFPAKNFWGTTIQQYRANLITREQLEQLIHNADTGR